MSSGHPHDHHHDHDHTNGHGPGHSHAPTSFGRAFAISAVLNIGLVIAQVVYGVIANSVALLADAGHNFGDVIGLLLAWAAYGAAQLRPTKRNTYGFRSAPILAALLNSLVLLVATGAIIWEAIRRLWEPGEVAGLTVIVVAAIGIVVNGLSAWLLMAGRNSDLNIRGAFLHLLGDAAVSVGVVLAGAAIYFTGWYRASADAISPRRMSFEALRPPRVGFRNLTRSVGSYLAEGSELLSSRTSGCRSRAYRTSGTPIALGKIQNAI